MNANAKLYRVAMKVRPLPGNPQYWDCQFGNLNMWLFADSRELAAESAGIIVGALPYERVGTKSTVHINVGAPEDGPLTYARSEDPKDQYLMDGFAQREALAKESGLSLLLMAVVTGANETGFEEFGPPL